MSKYLIVSGILHIFIALAISRIYAEQPPPQERRMRAVRIEYEEVKPPPKPKVVAKVQPKKVVPKKEKPKPKEEPKVTPQKVEPPKVTRRRRRMSASAPSLGAGTAPRQSRSAPGVTGIKGARGPTDELPAVRSASGIEDPNVITKTGGTGLTSDRSGSMATPTGSSSLPGAGGKEIAGFRIGASGAGDGVARLDISGSGGKGGRSDKGPGTGLSNFAGRVTVGGGRGDTGLGVGASDGMDGVDSESAGNKAGEGRGSPGLGGHQTGASRSAPNLTTGAATKDGTARKLPGTKSIPEEKRDGATGKKEFKAGAKTNMTSASRTIEKPEERAFGDALQGEINRNLHGLRKMYEDWQNLNIPGIPKVLQITVELGLEKGELKLQKLELHKADISSKIKNDLTRKIETWKFKSLYDKKDDPKT